MSNRIGATQRINTPAVTVNQPGSTVTNPQVKDNKPVFNTENKSHTQNSESAVIKRKKIDIDELIDKYKKNPAEVIAELGFDFTEAEIKELKSLLKDKNALKTLLRIADKEYLTAKDAMAAFKSVLNEKPSNIFKRAWTWITTAGKSERECRAENLSENMNAVRQIREEEFSTESVLSIGKVACKSENDKINVMHFVEQKATDGKFLYSEANVNDAVGYMQTNPDKVNEFIANTTELESIKDEKGNNKYTGDTNIGVGKSMTNNPELAPTMKKAAYKSDMNDEFLNNICSNLEKNPYMQQSIDFSLGAKNQDGTDRFSAVSINDESNHLVNKGQDYCTNYEANLKTLAKYNNLSSNDIIRIAENVTKNPEIMSDVINKIESGQMTGSEIADYSEKLVSNDSENLNNSTNSISSEATTASSLVDESSIESSKNVNSEVQKDSNIGKTKSQIESFLGVKPLDNDELSKNSTTGKIVTIDGHSYNEAIIKEALNKTFGSLSGTILEAIKKDPDCINVIKQYCNNPKVLKAYLEEPEFVNKIKSTAGTLTNTELEDLIDLCSDNSSKSVMFLALSNGSVTEAIKITKNAKITNSKKDALAILSNKTTSSIAKKQQLYNLFGFEKNSEIVA